MTIPYEGKKFSSIEAFYAATREGDPIERLIKELGDNTHSGEETNHTDWENSLPDLAELLYSPKEYVAKTIEVLDMFITAGEIIKDPRMESILKPEMLEGWRKLKGEYDDHISAELVEGFGKRKKKLEEFLGENGDVEKLSIPDDLEIIIEHEFDNNFNNNSKPHYKAADVILSHNGRSMIIELKQWTEEQTTVDDKGYIRGNPHPLMMVNYYVMLYKLEHGGLEEKDEKAISYFMHDENKDLISAKACHEKMSEEITDRQKKADDESLKVVPLVYLHNQYYGNGCVFISKDEDATLKKIYECNRQNGPYPIYTRHRCDKLIKQVARFFSENP